MVSEPDSTMLREAIRDHLAEAKKHINASTADARSRRLDAFLQWLHGDRPVSAITKRVAGQYLTDSIMKQEVSPKTKKDTVSDLHTFFAWCESRGLTETNPFAGLSRSVKESKRGTKAKRRPWTAAELRTMLTG